MRHISKVIVAAITLALGLPSAPAAASIPQILPGPGAVTINDVTAAGVTTAGGGIDVAFTLPMYVGTGVHATIEVSPAAWASPTDMIGIGMTCTPANVTGPTEDIYSVHTVTCSGSTGPGLDVGEYVVAAHLRVASEAGEVLTERYLGLRHVIEAQPPLPVAEPTPKPKPDAAVTTPELRRLDRAIARKQTALARAAQEVRAARLDARTGRTLVRSVRRDRRLLVDDLAAVTRGTVDTTREVDAQHRVLRWYGAWRYRAYVGLVRRASKVHGEATRLARLVEPGSEAQGHLAEALRRSSAVSGLAFAVNATSTLRWHRRHLTAAERSLAQGVEGVAR